MDIKQLVESLGIDNAESVAKELQESFDNVINEMKNENEIALAKRMEALEERYKAQNEDDLSAYKEKLREYQEFVVNRKLEVVEEQLKIAKDVRDVRNGLELIVEGMREAGVDMTQLYEAAAAAEVINLQEQVDNLEESIQEYQNFAHAFQRSFIISEATRDLSIAGRDAIVKTASAISEDVDAERFSNMVKALVEERKLNEKYSGNKEQDNITESKKNPFDNGNMNFIGSKPEVKNPDDISRFFKKY